jgi:hypothetical protein
MQPNQDDYTLPQGKKDIEIYEKSKQITNNFIDELNKKGFLKKYVTPEEDALNSKIMDRINAEAKSIVKLEKIFHDNKYQPFLDDIKKHDITEIDVMNYYMALLTHQVLDIFELFKKYLVITLDKEKLELKGNPSLGTILNHLESKKVNHRFDEIINKDLRNALGHSWYWWEKSEFYYTVDPTLKRTKKLTLGELYVITRKTALLTRSFIDNAFARIVEIKREDDIH